MGETSTITAFATPLSESAIAVIRVSGPDSHKIAKEAFGVKKELKARYSVFGVYKSISGDALDECLYITFKDKSSYTGEDALEIYCHGNPFIAKKIFSDLIARGCRQALPGEFTRRAFLNGKMDLTQAEAVADVISARSEIALNAAQKLLSGTLGKKISEWNEKIIRLLAEIESQIDFSDEEVPDLDRAYFEPKLSEIISELKNTENTARYSSAVHEGINVVIFGPPNAGKSSLLNVLVGEERALVSEEAGTTRDFISENINIGPYRIRILDTAGIREHAASKIEAAGIRRSIECMQKADFFIFVVDASVEAPEIGEEANALITPENTLLVLNKSDLGSVLEANGFLPGFERISLSLLDSGAYEALSEKILGVLKSKEIVPKDDVLIVGIRHAESLSRARDYLEEAIQSLGIVPLEFTANNLRSAMSELSEILGRFDNERILDKVFSSFCIGK